MNIQDLGRPLTKDEVAWLKQEIRIAKLQREREHAPRIQLLAHQAGVLERAKAEHDAKVRKSKAQCDKVGKARGRAAKDTLRAPKTGEHPRMDGTDNVPATRDKDGNVTPLVRICYQPTGRGPEKGPHLWGGVAGRATTAEKTQDDVIRAATPYLWASDRDEAIRLRKEAAQDND